MSLAAVAGRWRLRSISEAGDTTRAGSRADSVLQARTEGTGIQ